jgi:hypothetical protein
MDDNKMDLQEVEWEGMDWTDLAQNRERRGEVGDCCESGNTPFGFITYR